MSATFLGLSQPFRGLAFLFRNRELWKFALIPFLINLVVVAAAGVLLLFAFDDIFAIATSFLNVESPTVWYRWADFLLLFALRYLIGGLLFVVSLVLVYFVFLIAGSIIAAPFNEVLSERTERLLANREFPESAQTLLSVFRDGSQAIADEARKAGFFLAVFVLLLPLNLIPGVGSVLYTLASGVVAVFFVTLEFVDPALSRRRLRFREKRKWLYRNKTAVLGFGAVMFLALSVPIVNLLVLPVGAVAGAKLFVELGGVEQV